jgi:tRNA(fMet)-specific endonuclease VapC
MRRYLLDTGIAADWVFRRMGVRERAETQAKTRSRVGICTPVLGELWAGVEHSKTHRWNRQRLIRALVGLVVWPYDERAAEEFGRIYAHLRHFGRMIQQIDIQIAAVALTLGNCTVVTKDRDFQAIPNLDIEDWSKPA